MAVPVGEPPAVVEVPFPIAGAKFDVIPGSVEIAGVADVSDVETG